jgi:predicted permease
MTNLLHDVRYALRLLRKSPGTALTAVLLLAVGIGANTAVFSLVNTLFLKGLALPDSARLVHVYGQGPHGHYGAGFSYPEYQRLHGQMHSVSEMAAETPITQLHLVGEPGVREVRGAFVDAGYFSLLGVRPASGRFFLPEEDAVEGRDPVVVISSSLWRSYFSADADILGREISVNAVRLKIVGIAPSGFYGDGPGVPSELWIPMAMRRAAGYGCKAGEECADVEWMVARLASESTVQMAQSEASARIVWTSTDYKREAHRAIGVFAARGAHPDLQALERNQIELLSAATGILLLIACANLSGLLLAHGVARRKEIAVRLSIGASRWRIVRQILTENLLLAMVGGSFGLVISLWGTRLLSRFYVMNSEGFVRLYDFSPDLRLFLYLLLVVVVTGVLFGLFPALYASRQGLVTELKDGAGSTSRSSRRLRNALVSLQAGLSLVLVVCAALLTKSSRVLMRGANFDPEHVAVLRLRPELANHDAAKVPSFMKAAWQSLNDTPGVESVAMMVGGEGEIWHWDSGRSPDVSLPGESAAKRFAPDARVQDVDTHFFDALRISLLQGRGFTDHDSQGQPLVAVVNQTLAQQFWPGESALGHTLIIAKHEYRVVGVCANIQPPGAAQMPQAHIYRSFWQAGYAGDVRFAVRVQGDPAAMLPGLREAIHKLDPAVPLGEDMPLSLQLETEYSPLILARTVVSFCGFLALSLSALGLYSILAFGVRTRVREIGVRMALGADRGHVIRLVLREGFRIVLAGIVGGVFAGMMATRLLTAWLYGVQARDLTSFVAGSAALLIAALAAAWLPAHRASHVDPMVALRSE